MSSTPRLDWLTSVTGATPETQAWQPRVREAETLAQLIRGSRLTLLLGSAGCGKSSLLKSGVMPLLRRRADDWPRAADGAQGLPPPNERRTARADGAIEVAVYFNGFNPWNAAPLRNLQQQIHAAVTELGIQTPLHTPSLAGPPRIDPLAENLSALSANFGLRFLIVLDQFDRYLEAPFDRPGNREFADELVRALTQPALPVNFLIAVRDDAEPRLERFRSRVSEFGKRCLRLPALNAAGAAAEIRAPDDRSIELTPSLFGDYPWQHPDWVNSGHLDVAAPAKAKPSPATVPKAAEAMSPLQVERAETLRAQLKIRLRAQDDAPAATPALPLQPQAAAVAAGSARIQAAFGELGRATSQSLAAGTTRIGSAVRRGHSALHQLLQSARQTLSTGARRIGQRVGRTLQLAREARAVRAQRAGTPLGRPMPFPAERREIVVPKAAWLWLSAFSFCAVVAWALFQASRQTPAPPPGPALASAAVQAPAVVPPSALPSKPPPQSQIPVVTGPGVELFAGSDDGAGAWAGRDLARIVAPEAKIDLQLRPLSDVASNVRELQRARTPALAVVSYDAIRALAPGGVAQPLAAGKKSPQVVTPLFTREIGFLVRADSGLRYLHELKGLRIGAGPSGSDTRLTVERLYQDLFQTALAPADSSALAGRDALGALLSERRLDAIAVVEAQPVQWLLELPLATRQSLRLLRLDPSRAEARRALRDYLPARIRAANYPGWLSEDVPTLSVMSFLITASDAGVSSQMPLSHFASALCRKLPSLRAEGHPKWREVQLGLELDTRLPYSPISERAFQECTATAALTTAAGVSQP